MPSHKDIKPTRTRKFRDVAKNTKERDDISKSVAETSISRKNHQLISIILGLHEEATVNNQHKESSKSFQY
jgi:hypothetical protein